MTSKVQAIVSVVQARLDGDPGDYADWNVVVSQLKDATRAAQNERDRYIVNGAAMKTALVGCLVVVSLAFASFASAQAPIIVAEEQERERIRVELYGTDWAQTFPGASRLTDVALTDLLELQAWVNKRNQATQAKEAQPAALTPAGSSMMNWITSERARLDAEKSRLDAEQARSDAQKIQLAAQAASLQRDIDASRRAADWNSFVNALGQSMQYRYQYQPLPLLPAYVPPVTCNTYYWRRGSRTTCY